MTTLFERDLHRVSSQLSRLGNSPAYVEQRRTLSGANGKTKEAHMMAPITHNSLRDIRERINAFAERMQVRFVLVSRDAVDAGQPELAHSFNSDAPAVIAAKFPAGAGFGELDAFRRGLSEVIGQAAPVVSFNSVPRAILESRSTL